MTGSSWSWPRRRRLALVISGCVAGAAVVAAVLSSQASDWQPLGLLLTLAAFAVASEVFAFRLSPTVYSDQPSWLFSPSAAFVLAAVFLGPAPALVLGWLSLVAGWVGQRSQWRDMVANFANYGVFSITAGWLAELVMGGRPGEYGSGIFALVVGVYVWILAVSFVLNLGYGLLAYGESLRERTGDTWRMELLVEAPLILLTALTALVYVSEGLPALAVLAAVQLLFLALARELARSLERGAVLQQRTDELQELHEDLARHVDRISELSAGRWLLVGQVLSAAEDERRRLAESLHDEAMQNLLTARQDLTDPMNVERARAGLEATIDQLRDAIFELHPAVLRQVGLAAAVEAVAERAAQRAGFRFSLNIDPRAGEGQDMFLFMVIRELLANAAEHSGASLVEVGISDLPDGVLIEVTDDGRGFEEQRLSRALEEGHIGLALLAERVEAVGGTLSIDAGPGRGTAVAVRIPESVRAATPRVPA